MLILSFQPLLISISLPSREELKMFQGRLNLSVGVITKSPQEGNQEMTLTLYREKIDLVMRSERGKNGSTSRSTSSNGRT